ncbi:hypothetical protein GCM10009722_04490 [Williamsia deligens]
MDTLADVVIRGECAAADVEVEREVVLEEMAMREDDHEDLLADAFMTAVFGDQPIGRPVIGSAEVVGSLSASRIRGFHRRRYTPERMVVAVAGNITHAEVLAHVRRSFGPHLHPGTVVAPPRRRSRPARASGSAQVLDRDSEQAHLMIGMPTGGVDDPALPALSVLNAAVGGGLSSRLFQQIREERGLAYSVYSSLDTFTDVGTFSVYAGCNPERVGEVAAVVTDILADVAENGIDREEIDRAKGSLRGSMLLGLEDTGSRMHRAGVGEIDQGRSRPVTTSLRRIDGVRPAHVSRIAREVLSARPSVAVVGPYRRTRDLPPSIRALTG